MNWNSNRKQNVVRFLGIVFSVLIFWQNSFSVYGQNQQETFRTDTKFHPLYQRHHHGHYSPATALSARIHAQADLISAVGDAAVSHAEAARRRQDARSRALDNWVKYFRAREEIRNLIDQRKAREAFDRRNRQYVINSRKWEKIRDFPEFNTPGILSGKGLNFLLHRLSGNILAYDFVRKSSGIPDASEYEELELSPEVLSHLYLKENALRGESLVFRADQGVPDQMNRWPYELRLSLFLLQRERLEQAWQKLIQEAARGEISEKMFVKLDTSFEDLETVFQRRYTRESLKNGGMSLWKRYHTAKLFLRSLRGEIERLKSTHDTSQIFDGSRKFEGDNLIDLLKYMTRTGLIFAPAPGPENHPAYQDVFTKMKDLYVMVADDDDSIRPRKFNEQ